MKYFILISLFLVSCSSPEKETPVPGTDTPLIAPKIITPEIITPELIMIDPLLDLSSYKNTWQIVYNGPFNHSGANFVILDLFEHSENDVKKVLDAGAIPIAYFSAHYENWRPDANMFGKKIGKIGGWKGEYYVDWKDPKNQAVIKSRLKKAKDKGFLGIDPDNVDGPKGKDYFPFIYKEAKKLDLLVGLKNFVEILPEWGDKVDYFVSEAISEDELSCYKKYNKPTVRMYYGRGAKTPSFIFELKSGGKSKF